MDNGEGNFGKYFSLLSSWMVPDDLWLLASLTQEKGAIAEIVDFVFESELKIAKIYLLLNKYISMSLILQSKTYLPSC